MALQVDQQNIIKILGIEDLADERKIMIIHRVAELVEKRLLLRVFDSLSASKAEELTRLLDGENTQRVAGFLAEFAPNLASWAEEEVGKVKAELAKSVV